MNHSSLLVSIPFVFLKESHINWIDSSNERKWQTHTQNAENMVKILETANTAIFFSHPFKIDFLIVSLLSFC